MRGFVIFLFVSVSILVHAEISSLNNIHLSQCGINSLYLCLRYHKVDIRLDDMYSSIKSDAENNVSLKQLADYAKSKGLCVEPIINPSVEDIQRALQGRHSIVLQYNTTLPDNSNFKHIVALIHSDMKIFLLDYPKVNQELSFSDLGKIEGKSEGMLILSEKTLNDWRESLKLRSMK